jgi:cell division protease FtsH
VSILPRGTSLGATQQRVDTDRYIVTKRELEAKLRVLMAGYAAERTVFDDVSTGAEDDLKKASRIAQQMVSSFGMSEAIGPMHLELQSEHPFLGRRVAEEAQVSDATIYGVEQESRRLLVAALEVASEQLARHAGALEELVAALLDQETLDEDALLALLRRTVSSVPPERVASPAPRATNGQPTIEPEA